jgi:hypothetical protein
VPNESDLGQRLAAPHETCYFRSGKGNLSKGKYSSRKHLWQAANNAAQLKKHQKGDQSRKAKTDFKTFTEENDVQLLGKQAAKVKKSQQ